MSINKSLKIWKSELKVFVNNVILYLYTCFVWVIFQFSRSISFGWKSKLNGWKYGSWARHIITHCARTRSVWIDHINQATLWPRRFRFIEKLVHNTCSMEKAAVVRFELRAYYNTFTKSPIFHFIVFYLSTCSSLRLDISINDWNCNTPDRNVRSHIDVRILSSICTWIFRWSIDAYNLNIVSHGLIYIFDFSEINGSA